MDNHEMFYYDSEEELCLRRCCLCLHAAFSEDEMTCSYGLNCKRDLCDSYEPIARKDTTDRIAAIKEIERISP